MCQVNSVSMRSMTELAEVLSPCDLNAHLRTPLCDLRGVWSGLVLPTHEEVVRPAGENAIADRPG
jgi:hypothetical protein